MSEFIASLVAANRDLLPTNSTSEQGQCDNQPANGIELAFFLSMLAYLLAFVIQAVSFELTASSLVQH